MRNIQIAHRLFQVIHFSFEDRLNLLQPLKL